MTNNFVSCQVPVPGKAPTSAVSLSQLLTPSQKSGRINKNSTMHFRSSCRYRVNIEYVLFKVSWVSGMNPCLTWPTRVCSSPEQMLHPFWIPQLLQLMMQEGATFMHHPSSGGSVLTQCVTLFGVMSGASWVAVAPPPMRANVASVCGHQHLCRLWLQVGSVYSSSEWAVMSLQRHCSYTCTA